MLSNSTRVICHRRYFRPCRMARFYKFNQHPTWTSGAFEMRMASRWVSLLKSICSLRVHGEYFARTIRPPTHIIQYRLTTFLKRIRFALIALRGQFPMANVGIHDFVGVGCGTTLLCTMYVRIYNVKINWKFL